MIRPRDVKGNQMQPSNVFAKSASHLVLLLLVAGCGTDKGHPGGELSPDTLSTAALRTHACYVRSHRGGEILPSQEVPRSCWAREIKALHPLRVYLHRVNVVVVQRESGGVEEGKYISIIISSYLPQSGDDGFTFTNQDGLVCDFRRVKP